MADLGEKILFLREVMGKIVFSSLITVNGMLTTHRNNLSTHYYLTYHPCFDTRFCHGQTTQQYFRAVAMPSRKKRKRSSCPFVPRRAVKRKTGNCFDIDNDWAEKLAASDKGSYYTQHEFEEVVPGNWVAVILWLYSSVLIYLFSFA